MEKEKKARRSYVNAGQGFPFGKQRVVTWLAYVSIIVISVLASCYELLFDIENFDATRFATKLSISLCIAIMALLMALKDGKTTNESKKSGDYFETKRDFGNKCAQIVNKDWFRQWADEVLYPRERKSAVEAILNEYGITDYEYMEVSDDDFAALRLEPKICKVGKDKDGNDVLKPLEPPTKNQYKLIAMMRSSFRFKRINYSYFTSRSAGAGYAYYANLKDNQRKREIFALAYRVFMVLIISTILALAAINPMKENGAQIAFDTTGRMLTLFSSCFMGYTLANDEMRENIDSMIFKMEKLDEYIIEKESGQFVPVSKDDVIRAKIEEIERRRVEEAEKAKASVVTPEVVPVKSDDPPAIEYKEIEMTADEYEAFKSK